MISRKSKQKPLRAKLNKGPSGSILSKLFRTILFNYGMDDKRYDALMARYIRKAAMDVNRKDRADVRAGLSGELLKTSMTWKTFLKGLKFLSIAKMSIVVRLWKSDETCILYRQNYSLDTVEVEFGSEDDDEKLSKEGIMTAGSILGSFFEEICRELKVGKGEIPTLLAAYIKRTHVGADRRSEAAVRASLMKELFKPIMTWKSFIKGLNFLGICRFELMIVLEDGLGKNTEHSLTPIVLDEIEPE